MNGSTIGRRFLYGASGRFVFAALLAVSAGCKSEPGVVAPSAEELALEEVKGNAEVRAAQARVKTAPSPEAWLVLAESWLRQARISGDAADFRSADAAAAKAEALGAKNAAGVRALTLLNRQRFEEARALAEATLAKDPEDLRSLAALSDALLELGRLEESGRAVQRMIDLKPNLPSYGRASWLRWMTGDVTGAKQLIRLALDAGRDPRDVEPRAWTLCQAASYFWHEGDYEGSEAGYDQALALVPDYPPALVGKARAALSRSEAIRAKPLVQTAFAKQPTVLTGILRARVLEALGDPGAEEAWRAAAALGTRDSFGLGWLSALEGENLEEARKLLETERAGRPGVYVLDAHSWALFRLGRLDEAEEASVGANRFGTKDARLWYHLGAIRLARGQHAEGRALIEKALALNPAWDRVEAGEARKLIGAH
jgi:tetratricopeptide (TPR) repeat protein